MSRPVCWITGGSRGIGAACARALAAEYDVAVGYGASREQAEALAASIRADGGNALAVQADAACREALFRAAREVGERLGHISLLVTCAGVAWTGLAQEMPEADVRRVLDVDLAGTIFACQAVLPDMFARKSGCIVTVSSIWGLCGASCEAVYSAAKAGVIGWTRALAQEAGPSGVRVNCVAPGVIRTEMLANLSEADLAALADETPLGRIGMPEDIAAAVRYLASADFVTGQVLSPNGGLVI